ncbi:M20/M25/M40 family metallo-hydrolase [Pseudopedobacter beijingensis]|uniref:M20/M25/M40 family metallo-hydrolase n=1 Tax=Pseudopedobacter beijingensis TaxID=1207056 RepID=A0ABW4IDS8_9SPHI
MKKLILIILILILILAGILIIKTITYPFVKIKDEEKSAQPIVESVSDSALYRFSQGIKIPTVSVGELGVFNFEPFEQLVTYLKSAYPEVHRNTQQYTVNNGFGHVYIWKGKNSSLKPILFLSHIDVVTPGDAPVKNETSDNIFQPQDKPLPSPTEIAKEWEYGPFSGAVAGGRIYGRGTMDMKGMLFSLMESMTALMKSGFVPERDIYLALGCDEEVGGLRGAKKIAEDFKSKGLTFDAVFDEGGVVMQKGALDGVNTDVALIGLAEKGFLSAKIKVNGLGGHSSIPPLQSAIGKAAVIMQRLETEQMKPTLTPLIKDFFQNVGGEMPFTSRMAIANTWLLEPILLKQLTKTNTTNALIRTTTALTMMKGSDGTNVLSPQVEFVVNFRILPGNTIEEVKKHIAKACEGFDTEVEEIDNTRKASKVSPTNARGYKIIAKTIKSIYPDALITPYLTLGGTDSYKYEIVSDNVYRFIPFAINNYEQQSIHSTNEYISIENYGRMIKYFGSIMKEYDMPE